MPWISVKERLPENDADVLVFMPRAVTQIYVGFYDDVWQWDGGDLSEVTHWMHLPDPPE